MHHLPYELEVDAEVPVDQAISHARRAPPIDLRVGRTKPLGQSLRPFADHLEAADEGPLQGRVGQDLGFVDENSAEEADGGGAGGEVVDRVQVEEQLRDLAANVLEVRHLHHGDRRVR
jgi:hypothetical protein